MKQDTYTLKIPQIKLFGYHGFYDKEKKEGQEFEINIEVVFKRTIGNYSLVLHQNIFDYTKIVSAVKQVFEQKRCDMLEELTRNIGRVLFDLYYSKSTEAESVKVNIKKFNPEGMNIPYVEVGCVITDVLPAD
tara:strand:+ start:34 stop:432 length:399 start_codon:yes stop_codon:yes gene_type:complete